MQKSVNIVSFDVPFPPNYGGVIDVYYKLLWLKRTGVKIYLHCFQYGRAEAAELKALCEEVHYYPRNTNAFAGISTLPYTVNSRRSAELERRLLSNDFPIIFEVLHTCYLMKDERFRNRIKIYRHSNIEHEYYEKLAESEKNMAKKFYLKVEAKRLQFFEKIIVNANYILAVNSADANYFAGKYPRVKTIYLPSFHEHKKLNIETGNGNYVLYHGNLSVSENYEAAGWLIENVFSRVNARVIIAGLNPPQFLKKLIERWDNITLIENPDHLQMQTLIREAQIHCLFTKQPTGLKLKLLNVLYTGRFILCNPHMLAGTSLHAHPGIRLCPTAEDFRTSIAALLALPFDAQHLTERMKLIAPFDCEQNAEKIAGLI